MSSSRPRDLPSLTDLNVACPPLGIAEAASPESVGQRDAAVFPDEAPFDRIAWRDGCEAYHEGFTWQYLRAAHGFAAWAGEPVDLMLAWRKSYCFGYLAAQHAAGAR